MTITAIKLERFTAFESLEFKPSPGINVLIGANGTGKTHLMKVAYAACDITRTRQSFGDKLVSTFLPSGGALGRLVKRRGNSSSARINIQQDDKKSLSIEFSNHIKEATHPKIKLTGAGNWFQTPVECVFIPVKEMLANAPGFRSLYSRREVHFESVYADIIDRAYLPTLRGPKDAARKRLLTTLQRAMDGKVIVKGEEFFLKNPQGDLEFMLVAEGWRKLGLLWLLIQNGTLSGGSVVFWDEPETNLNPQLHSLVIEIIIELHRLGAQIFLATHSYAIMKEFELAARKTDQIRYHALFNSVEADGVRIETQDQPFKLEHSPISAAMSSLYDREVRRALGGTA